METKERASQLSNLLSVIALSISLTVWLSLPPLPRVAEAQTVRPAVISYANQAIIGLAASQLPDSGTVLSVTLKCICPGATVYVGRSNAVLATTGFPLNDGDSITVELSNANQYFAISTAANMRLAILGIRRQ